MNSVLPRSTAGTYVVALAQTDKPKMHYDKKLDMYVPVEQPKDNEGSSDSGAKEGLDKASKVATAAGIGVGAVQLTSKAGGGAAELAGKVGDKLGPAGVLIDGGNCAVGNITPGKFILNTSVYLGALGLTALGQPELGVVLGSTYGAFDLTKGVDIPAGVVRTDPKAIQDSNFQTYGFKEGSGIGF